MTINKSYHCVYQIHYHIVFPLKFRKALLHPCIEQKIISVAKQIQERYEIKFEKIGADNDHIHLLCGSHPKYSPGSIVRIFKSITAREIFKAFPEIKKDLWGGEFWSDGYYVGTVSESEKGNWKTVEEYINNQGKKPQDVNLHLFKFDV